MEITFHKVMKIKIDAVKNPDKLGGLSWLQINVYDQDGEHIINCFPETGDTIPPISLHPMADDEDDD